MKKFIIIILIFPSVCLMAQENCNSDFNFSIDTNQRPGPYTHLNLNNSPCKFQFAIVTDRTGGHREGVFMDGINKLNLLQPEFVMSVGDLIEGYTMDTAELRRQWDEFESFVYQLQMPFFFLPGNHDITNQIMEDIWKQRFGATYYHFIYKDVLFVCLNSEDRRRGAGRGTISDEQFEYIREVLSKNENVRWTLLFMHQPLWHQEKTERWQDVEKLLSQRPHTVFAGHEHRYVKNTRNNGKYFTLATTGGGSPLRGPELGEFDHVMWVTMTNQGPVMANLQLSGIWDENVVTKETKSLIEKLATSTPLEIEPPVIEGSSTKNIETSIKIVNNEDIPMRVKFEVVSSSNLTLNVTPDKSITIPPNSVGQAKLHLYGFDSIAKEPALLKAEVSLASGDEPALVTYPYKYNIKPLIRRQLLKSSMPITVDAELNDWPELRHYFEDPKGDNKVWWDLRYDQNYLYLAAKVEDDTIISTGNGAAFRQDNIAFGFNAEKASKSAMSVGRDWYSNEFLQLITPSHGDTASVTYREMPEGSEIKSTISATGYQAELAVPMKYILDKQGENWSTIRVNIGIDDSDKPGQTARSSWLPLWRNDDNFLGSGLFWRE